MFTFAYPGLLTLLILVPVFVSLYFWCRWWRAKAMKRFGRAASLRDLTPGVSPYKPPVKLTLRMIALTMLIIAAARPWGGVREANSSKEGIEVVIAVDASNSMLAPVSEDGGADRMRTAKMIMERLIDRLDNDRVGLIVYAGDAYTLIPVTNDYASAKMFLNSIEPSMIQNQGTDIGKAVRLAISSFSKEKNIGKALILITDAEELESVDDVSKAVEEAADKNVQVDVLGVGGTVPVTIPEGTSLMIDPSTGQPVRTSINEQLAVDIAKEGKGIYVNSGNPDALNELTKQLNKLQKKTLEASFMAVHDELYALFGWIALVAILADIFLLNRKMYMLDKINFFKRKGEKLSVKRKAAKLPMIAILIWGAAAATPINAATSAAAGENGVGSSVATSADDQQNEKANGKESSKKKRPMATKVERKMILEGNALYKQKKYRDAFSRYSAAVKDNPQSAVGTFNLGLTQIRLSEAAKAQAGNAKSAPAGNGNPQPGQAKAGALGGGAAATSAGQDSISQALGAAGVENLRKVAERRITQDNLSSKAYYNIGNYAFNSQNYGEAIQAYKEALRLNPSDDNARRNLRIAQKKQEQNKDKNKDKNQDKNQDKKDQQDKQNQQNQQNKQDKQNQQNQPPKPQQIDNQTADRILKAVERKENAARMQMNRKNEKANPQSSSNRRW